MMRWLLRLLIFLVFVPSAQAQSLRVTWADNSGVPCGGVSGNGSCQEDYFILERRTGQTGPFVEIVRPVQDVTIFTDSAISYNTAYCYQIKAVNTGGSSNYSNIACATVTPLPPNAVLQLSCAKVDEPTIPAGRVLALNFNEGGGTTVRDPLANITGTLSGATWITTGKYGNALNFNGTNALVTIPDSAALHLTTGMTLEAWVYPTALTGGTSSGWRTVLLKEQTGDLTYGIYANNGTVNRPDGYIFVTAENNTQGTATLALNVWTHLALTYDGAALKLYVNGALASSRAVTGAIKVSTNPLRIGGNTIWSEYFQGRIDEVRMYNRALLATEITTDMTTPLP